MQSLNSAMRTVQQPLTNTTARWQPTRPAVARVSQPRPVAVAAAAAEDYASEPRAGNQYEQYPDQQQYGQQQQYQQRGGRGGGRGYRNNNNSGRGGYNSGRGDYRGQRNNYNNDGNNAAGYDGPRSTVSYDEDGGARQGRGYGGGRGGGRGRYGGGRGGDRQGGYQKQRRVLSPEAQAVNEALGAATTWRQLNTVLEQQSRPGMPGLDAYQLVDVMMRLTKRDMVIPTQGDDLADFQQFIASVYGWMLERMGTMNNMQLCGAVFAMGMLNLYNGELLEALMAAAYPRMGSFNAQQHARMLNGLQRLNVAPSADMQAVLLQTETATRIVGAAERDELGVILSSLQRLGLTPPQEWLDIMAQAFLASIQTQEQATMMRSDNFTKPLVGLAGLGWKPTPEQWQQLVEASRTNIAQGYYKARQLMEVAWAFAQFGSPVPLDWSQAFNYQMFNQSQYLYPADIGHLLYSMAYIKAKPNRDQLQRMLRSLKERIDRATGDDIANVLLALAEFEYTPMSDEVDDMLIQLQARLSSCSAAGLNSIIAALPAMGSGARLKTVVNQAVARYDAMMAEQQYGAAPVAEDEAAAAGYDAAAEQQPVA